MSEVWDTVDIPSLVMVNCLLFYERRTTWCKAEYCSTLQGIVAIIEMWASTFYVMFSINYTICKSVHQSRYAFNLIIGIDNERNEALKVCLNFNKPCKCYQLTTRPFIQLCNNHTKVSHWKITSDLLKPVIRNDLLFNQSKQSSFLFLFFPKREMGVDRWERMVRFLALFEIKLVNWMNVL